VSRLLPIFVFLVLAATPAQAKTYYDWHLVLTNGDSFRCELLEKTTVSVKVRWELQPNKSMTVPLELVKKFGRTEEAPPAFPWQLQTRRGDRLRVRLEGVTRKGVRFCWEMDPGESFVFPLEEVTQLRPSPKVIARESWRLQLRRNERLWGRFLGLDEFELRFETPILGALTIPRVELKGLTQDSGDKRAWPAAPKRRSKRRRQPQLSLKQSWALLSHLEAEKRWLAFQNLVRRPQQAVPFLAGRLLPQPDDPRYLRRLILDLDNDDWRRRDHATQRLIDLGVQAEKSVGQAQQAPLSPESAWRLRYIVDHMVAGEARDSSEVTRVYRALHVLERIGSKAARELVERVAGGAPEAQTTLDAREVMKRLEQP